VAWAFVQKKDSAGATATFASNTTSGNQIVVVNNAVTGATGVTISPGSGTFTKIVSEVASGLVSEIWYCPNVTGGTTPTVTLAGGSGPGPTCYEFSGGNTSGTLDGTNSATGTSASLTTGAVVTVANGDLVIKGFSCLNTPNGTVQSGWTETNPTLNGNATGFIIQGTAGSITGTDTMAASALFTGVIATLKAAAGGGTTPLGTAALQFKVGVTSAPTLRVMLTSSIQFKVGITSGALRTLLQAALVAHFGLTSTPLIRYLLSANIQFKAGVTQANVKAMLHSGIIAHFGVVSLAGLGPNLTGGGNVTVVSMYFTDSFGLNRISPSQ
jgi:hypothetical protein